jgi:GTP cyclohydrolase IA
MSRTRRPTSNIDRPAAAAAIDAFLRAIGRDPTREPDLVGTGQRVADAFLDELCVGYTISIGRLVAENRVAAKDAPAVILARDVPVTIMCPHHLLPATGKAQVAFAPKRELIGVGAIVQLVDALSRRLVLQETLSESIVDTLMIHLSPRWAACTVRLSHGCMIARGERSHGTTVETLSVRKIAASEARQLLVTS